MAGYNPEDFVEPFQNSRFVPDARHEFTRTPEQQLQDSMIEVNVPITDNEDDI